MTTRRAAKNKNYTTINNTVLNDVALSWKAKGLAAYLLSKPDDWHIRRDHLAEQSEDGISAVRSALAELEKFGYLTRSKTRDESGFFAWEFTLHETPQNRTPLKKKEGGRKMKTKGPPMDYQPVEPSADNPSVDFPPVENRTLVSTEGVSTDLLSTETAYSTRVDLSNHHHQSTRAWIDDDDRPLPTKTADLVFDETETQTNGQPRPTKAKPTAQAPAAVSPPSEAPQTGHRRAAVAPSNLPPPDTPPDHLSLCAEADLRRSCYETGVALFGDAWAAFGTYTRRADLTEIMLLLEWIDHYAHVGVDELNRIDNIVGIVRAHLKKNERPELRPWQRQKLIQAIDRIGVAAVQP